MTNKGHFKEEIFELACEGDTVAVDKRTNEPCKCDETECCNCALFNKIGLQCAEALAEWLKAEYVEPCPFEKDELVEVSNNGVYWCLRYFSHIDEKALDRKFVTFVDGEKSEETSITINWIYCQKYGTLGGLVKGEQ